MDLDRFQFVVTHASVDGDAASTLSAHIVDFHTLTNCTMG